MSLNESNHRSDKMYKVRITKERKRDEVYSKLFKFTDMVLKRLLSLLDLAYIEN